VHCINSLHQLGPFGIESYKSRSAVISGMRNLSMKFRAGRPNTERPKAFLYINPLGTSLGTKCYCPPRRRSYHCISRSRCNFRPDPATLVFQPVKCLRNSSMRFRGLALSGIIPEKTRAPGGALVHCINSLHQLGPFGIESYKSRSASV